MFTYFGDGSYYDALRDTYGEEFAFKRYQDKLGKLLVATVKNDGDTRLFIRSINPITDERKKNGWWNTFTITQRGREAGTYICKIDDVRADKNGYPIFVAHPIIRVDEDVLGCNELTYLFCLSEMFIEDHGRWNAEYNHANFEDQVAKLTAIDWESHSNHHISVIAAAVELFINRKLTKEQIVEWLNEKPEWKKQEEAFADEVCRFFNSDLEAMVLAKDVPGLMEPTFFPLTAEKVLRVKAEPGCVYTEQKVDFVKQLLYKYEAAVGNGHIAAFEGDSIWGKIETFLEFDKARKDANKAAKTAAKKAKKAAAKANS